MSPSIPTITVRPTERPPVSWSPVSGDLSAVQTTTVAQRLIFCGAIVTVTIVGVLWGLVHTINLLNEMALAFYGLILIHRSGVLTAGLIHSFRVPWSPPPPAAPARASSDSTSESLPLISVMIPLYKEAEVLKQIRDAMGRMDYPSDRYEVLLLLEEDDIETQKAATEACLPASFRVVVVPPGKPRTKPRACNHGLLFCHGDIVVIFDAEDQPENDQFLKAAYLMANAEPDVACLQARLAFYNPLQNVLTRLFATEYLSWFGIMLPGLHVAGSPIPLGGTSNYFRPDLLRKSGGWDSWNVAEDCDLGMRLYRNGYQVQMLNSTTWEEACPAIRMWIRQRSRWVKGYMQTWLVHTRHPIQTLKDLGFWKFLNMQLVVGGSFACLLLNPVYWVLTLLWLVYPTDLQSRLMIGPTLVLGNISLVAGNLLFIGFHCAGALRKKQWNLAAVGLIVPLYWALMSMAAWKAAVQLIWAPHYWEKTSHGLAKAASHDELPAGGV